MFEEFGASVSKWAAGLHIHAVCGSRTSTEQVLYFQINSSKFLRPFSPFGEGGWQAQILFL